ncbi:sorbosone dehydrogenase family protein [Sphingomonas sp.]|uniref:PQQ-dependent sugar dehydrogenase n=1 Tax=Sphingomonas sp. TaxID=28214 RepID=UPI002BDED049|nr:sorbosone dehydrogenase family protein [Sphingomonas sp.]HTG39154.1 sorbosone dehydrogenase family protein [Sphingomonas sp.]
MRKHILIVLGLIVAVGAGVFFWMTRPDKAQLPIEQVMGKTPRITAPRRQYFPTIQIAEPIGWQNGAKPTPAAGLAVDAFATGLDHPRWMYRLPNGDVLVAETNSPPRDGGGIVKRVQNFLMGRAGAGVPSANRITLLRDADGDGRAEGRSVLLSGLNSPFGMALMGDWLYVGNTDALVRFPFRVGQTRIEAKGEKIVDLPAAGNHWTRNVIANPNGNSLFVAVGSDSNIGENGMDRERNRASILEVFPDQKRYRVYAAGLRNPVGMGINPVDQSLWTVVNERDMIGSDVPPDYLTRVEFGGFYGWPWNYWGGYTDKRVEPQRLELREYTRRPDYALGPHTASLGLSFAEDIRLGDRFGRGAFIGQHGSWNREPPAGYKVLFVPFAENGFPTGALPVEVLTGFLDSKGRAQGRPVGVTGDRTGALLVADDVGNVIWRVRPAR